MQLKYRGVNYEYSPPRVEMDPSGQVGQYRGLEWRFRNPKTVPVLQSNLDLVYRGVPYRQGQAVAAPVPAAADRPMVAEMPAATPEPVATPSMAMPKVKDLARSLMMAHHTWIKRREQSLLSRAAAEVGLEADAGQYWRPIQGKINPGFRNTYDRSHAALS